MVRSILLAILFLPSITSAHVIISEIMYDLAEGSDSGREWIEVYNTSASPITLTELTLFESNRKHTVKGEVVGLPPYTYAIIADKPEKFRADHPNYTGLIFDSAFGLTNDGETLELRKGDVSMDSASYAKSLGGNGSGESLQRTALASSGIFAPGLPTPGAPIPAGGLARALVSKKPSTKTKTPQETTSSLEVLGAQTARNSIEPFEVAQENPGITLWLFGALAIAGVGITGAVLARRRDELDEWTIIEEM